MEMENEDCIAQDPPKCFPRNFFAGREWKLLFVLVQFQ